MVRERSMSRYMSTAEDSGGEMVRLILAGWPVGEEGGRRGGGRGKVWRAGGEGEGGG